MADHELSISEKGLVSLTQQQGMGELLKPLTREIHLFDTFVAGTARLSDPAVLKEIKVGDLLSLVREESKFDENGIVILTQEKKKLGYIPEKDTAIFARLMDAGKLLIARVADHEQKGSFHQIRIGIYLVDF